MKKLNKKVLFAAWACHNKKWHTYQLWDQPLRDTFAQVETFDPQEQFYKYGKDVMNKNFLEVVKREKPDYIFYWVMYHEFYPETLMKVKEMLPNCITFCYNGDDDYKFENYTINLFPVIDYFMITQVPYIYKSEEYGRKAFFGCGANIKKFKPKNVEKDIDVSFVGTPKSERVAYMRHLLKNGIKIRVYGAAWQRYPEFKDSHGGEINEDGFIDVINRSKINICLSQNYFGGTHILERFFEINACRSFVLTEHASGYFPTFKEGKDIVTFKNKDELLDKVKLYLKNDVSRKKVAEQAYKRTIKDFSNHNLLREVVNYAEKHGPAIKSLPKIDKKFIYLTKVDLKQGKSFLEKKTQGYDYICFKNKGYERMPYKEYFQMHSLELTKKPLATCDLMVYSSLIKDVTSLALYYAYQYLDKKYFYSNLDISQVMTSRNFFLENIEKFNAFYKGNKPGFINTENTVMMSFPLVRTKKIKPLPLKNTEHILFNFYVDKLLALRNSGTVTSDPFTYKLILYCLLFNRPLLSLIINEDVQKSKNPKLIRFSNILRRFI